MASISTYVQSDKVSARSAAADGYITILLGESFVIVSRKEAAQLVVELTALMWPEDAEVAA